MAQCTRRVALCGEVSYVQKLDKEHVGTSIRKRMFCFLLYPLAWYCIVESCWIGMNDGAYHTIRTHFVASDIQCRQTDGSTNSKGKGQKQTVAPHFVK